jgi:HTH-type transcriptional regulator, transcriptional repressor of NAD biosynthesis genes
LQNKIIKVILTGPESTGKSTLAKQLANHFNAPLVEEYARTFFEKKETPQYVQEDLDEIAKGQLDLEQQAYVVFKNLIGLSPHLIICDTDLLTLKIWSTEVFSDCSEELAQLIDYQLIMDNGQWTIDKLMIDKGQLKTEQVLLKTIHFLCSPEGIEWEDDPLRENPNDRDRLFKIYETELKFNEKKYEILRGDKNERFEQAIKAIERNTDDSPVPRVSGK